jgi:predicted lysophospholipase L1 biosynthesis ABC-type transport system permease subunit
LNRLGFYGVYFERAYENASRTDLPDRGQRVEVDRPVAELSRIADALGAGGEKSFERLDAAVATFFAALAALLAGIATYGFLAQTVARRYHEIGIRMALGARAFDIRRLVGRQILLLTVVGVATGLGEFTCGPMDKVARLRHLRFGSGFVRGERAVH